MRIAGRRLRTDLPRRFAALGLCALAVAGSGGVVAARAEAPRPAIAAVPAAALTAVPIPAPLPVEAAVEAPAPVTPVVPTPTAAAPPAPAVRPLGTLHAPDLLLTVPTGLDAAALGRVEALRGVQAVTALDLVTVSLDGRRLTVAGVDPSQLRAFTPRPSAASDALWAAVAGGALVAERTTGLALGSELALPGGPVRLGALASLGVPGVDAVVDRALAARLGAPARSGLLLAAPGRSLPALRRAVVRAAGGSPAVTVLRAAPVPDRPQSYRELYIASARLCPGLSWTVLAAVGQVESGHGRNLGPSSAGALGPMQFLPSTWEAYGVDGDRNGTTDIMDPFDAVPSAALYLCRFGGGRDADGLYDALFAYNHADWYVRKVLALAAQYR